MTYPQPSATDYATHRYGFFRLNATLSSPGDIYEAAQSANAFAIGPDSDIANAVAVYIDDYADTTTLMQQIAFSANRAVVGSIYEREDVRYMPADRSGRILLYCNDIFDPNFRPDTFDPDNDTIEIVTPVLDIMQYFAPQPSLGPARVDRRYYFQDYQVFAGAQWLVLPFYGRRYGSIRFKNTSTGAAAISVYGVNYGITPHFGVPLAERSNQETTLLGPTALAAGGRKDVLVLASVNGSFDAIAISTNVNPMAISITFSDFE